MTFKFFRKKKEKLSETVNKKAREIDENIFIKKFSVLTGNQFV